MKLPLPFARSSEERARQTAPLPLREHAGVARFAKALSEDRLYWGCVSAAFGLALLAGGGFGHTAAAVGWLQAGLWCLTAAGVAARALVPEAAIGDANAMGMNRALLLWGLLIAAAGVLASLASGANALPVLGAAGFIAAIVGLLSRTPIAGEPRIAPTAEGKANLVLALMRCAALAWAWMVFDAGGSNDFRFITFAIVMISLVALDMGASRSRSFAVVIAAVIFVHLAAMAQDMRSPYAPLWSQVAVACVEAALLVVAAFRHAIAALWLIPGATYRVAPLCVVPRLDRAQDHPVKINVA